MYYMSQLKISLNQLPISVIGGKYFAAFYCCILTPQTIILKLVEYTNFDLIFVKQSKFFFNNGLDDSVIEILACMLWN